MRPDDVLASMEEGASGYIQERTKRGILTALGVMNHGGTLADATRIAGVAGQTMQTWRRRYLPFDEEVTRLIGVNAGMRKQVKAAERQASLESQGLVLSYDETVPDRGTLTEFRMNYFGRPTPLHQQAAVAALEDPSNLYVFIFGPTGPQPLSESVLTPDGWVKMGDILVGDLVIGRDGTPARVLNVTDASVNQVLVVHFDDGTSVEAAVGHTWTAKAHTRRRGWHQVETWEFAAKLKDGRSWNWQIPVVAPVQLPVAEFVLDPYLIGVLLGDGCLRQNSPKVSTADPQIIEELGKVIPDDCRLHQVDPLSWHIYSDAPFRPTPLRAALDDLDMWGEYSYDKRVPDPYLLGSVDQRVALLQGLMDTDGTINEAGACSFATTSPRLADDVAGLVRSLGGWASISSRTRPGRRTEYHVQVVSPMVPFRLSRKAERWGNRKRAITRKVVDVTVKGWEECRCLTVEDSHYVTSNYTVTHNSGKDTLAGDYVAYESAPDRTGMRVAWFMETGPFSQRRLGRLSRYLTDPAAYRMAPDKTPGGQVPPRSLIDDYGPFQWTPGMVWEDGKEVHRPRFTANEMYYVRATAPEQDPNLWATGVEGASYGSRIDLCVCSDMFTKENQKSPTARRDQYDWFDGTLDTRLDAHGRLVVIGTWLPVANNYEEILDNYLEGARVLRQQRYGPGVYTKYSNGVAVVIVKAIYPDVDTDEELSYWPDRFPLSDHLLLSDGTAVPVDELSDKAILELTDEGAARERGLKSKRQRSPLVFKAMFQQERDRDVEVTDFTDEVLDLAMDDTRSFGQIFGHEIRLIGVDPARRYGAGWVLLCVDKANRKITIGDFWWGEQLGYTGIKNKLILGPLGRFDPSWLCYEDNREGSVLGDTVIWKAIDSAGVSVFTHTTGLERGSSEVGPGALATWMRNGQLLIPAMTAEDRQKADQLRSHFKAWDSNPDRSKPGRAGHDPDDLTMATWVAWLKAAPMIDTDLKDTGIIRGVPAAIKRRYDRATKERSTRGSGKPPNPRDVLTRGDPLTMIRTFAEPDPDA